MKKLSVSEVFLSIQGEGMSAGRRAVFLRLAGCNLMCGGQGTQFDQNLHGAKWRCDTIEVWMNGSSRSFDEVLNEECMNALMDGSHLVITGGEPMLQQDALTDFLNDLDMDIYVEVETNGTIEPTAEFMGHVAQWNISPKLSSSGNMKSVAINDEVLCRFSQEYDKPFGKVQFKFVVHDSDDLKEIMDLDLPRERVWLMPSGSTREELDSRASFVASSAILLGYNYSHRLQVAIWNLTTGV